MKWIPCIAVAAGLFWGAISCADAAEFRIKGQLLTGLGLGETSLTRWVDYNNGRQRENVQDMFQASQRLRLQLGVVTSKGLSGTMCFEVGDIQWGNFDQEGVLGTDRADRIKMKRAFLDWTVPQTDLEFRIGLQGVALPGTAGGSVVLDTDVAGVTASWQYNKNVGLTVLWARPFNDDFEDIAIEGVRYKLKDLHSVDLFALLLPLKSDGIAITPWAMYGLRHRNTDRVTYRNQNGTISTLPPYNENHADGYPNFTLLPYFGWKDNNAPAMQYTDRKHGSMFWAGLPFSVSAWEPWNIEVDLNYGYVESLGSYATYLWSDLTTVHSTRSSTKRQGWLVKALAEYKLGWATPGIFGWYASGDDGNPQNGSESMPSLAPKGTFTSFMGHGNYGWGPGPGYVDKGLSYAGTWGIGLRLKNMSFINEFDHTLSVTYWGGTNNSAGIRYLPAASSWNYGTDHADGPYLTTKDGLLEFNLINTWRIQKNLEMNLELGYIANFMSSSTWDQAGAGDTSFGGQNAWKTQLIMAYTF